MSAQLQHQITYEPRLVLDTVLNQKEAYQFFNSNLPYSDIHSFLCCPITPLENNQGKFYQVLGYYIQLIMQTSLIQDVKRLNLSFGQGQIASVIQYFFGSFPDQFIYDQNFCQGVQKISQTLNITIDILRSGYLKQSLSFQGQPASLFLMIYQNQNQLQIMIAKKIIKFQTTAPTQKIVPSFVKQQTNNNNQQINLFGSQFKLQTPYNPNTQIQQNFQPFKANVNKMPQQNYGQVPQTANQFQQPAQSNPNQYGDDEMELMQTDDINNLIAKKAAQSSKCNNETLTSLYQKPVIKKINLIQPDCLVCYDKYKSDNNEALLTACCQKKPHKACYIQYLNEIGSNCSNFNLLQCYLCQKPVDQKFLKEILNKATFLKIVTQLNKLQTKFKCYQCESPLIFKEDQNKILCPQPQCQREICPKCLMEYHGDNRRCPQLQKELLEALKGQPIVICPFCNYIQTKDEKCDHVTCYYCKKELCSACCCDRRPTMRHGNHFHRLGCPHYSGAPEQKQKLKEWERNCPLCKDNGGCLKPISLLEYKKEKNF